MRPTSACESGLVLSFLLTVLAGLPAMAQPDLVAEKTNSVGGAGTVNVPFTWSIAIRNIGDASATTAGFMIFVDSAPTTNISYGAPTVTPSGGASGFFTCSFLEPGSLQCLNGSGFEIPPGGAFTVAFQATASAAGTYTNPSGVCMVDLTGAIAESNEGNNTCSDTVVVSSGATGPDLAVAKSSSVSGSTELAAGSYTWSLSVSNGGTASAVFAGGDTLLVDNLPNSNISYANVAVTGQSGITGTLDCSLSGSDLTCLAEGQVTIAAAGQFTVDVEATPLAAGSFVNPRGGGVCAVDPDLEVTEGDETNNSCSETVMVSPSPDLTASKTNNTSGSGTVDEAFTWTIRVDNVGGAAYSGSFPFPLLFDSLPDANVAYGTPQTSSSGLSGAVSCAITNSNLECTPTSTMTLAAGGHFTVSFTATPSAPGDFVNPRSGGSCQADISNHDTETNELNNACADTVTVDTGATGPDLTVAKNNDVGGATETGNGPFNWSLQVTNGGDAEATFTNGQTILVDNLPSSQIVYDAPTVTGLSGVTGTVSCSIVSSDLSCLASGTVTIAAAGTFTANVAATAQAGGTFDNPRGGGACTVDPSDAVSEGDENNNSCSNSVVVADSPDLTATKSNDTEGVATAGQPFEWAIEVRNEGQGPYSLDAPFLLLVDTLPNENISYGTPTTSSSNMTGTVNCSIDGSFNLQCAAATEVTIAPGGLFTVRFAATPSATGAFANPRAAGSCVADVQNRDVETHEDNNSCSDTVTVQAGPDLTVSKGNDRGGLTEMAEGAFVWSLEVNNGGDQSATFAAGNEILVDNLPNSGLVYESPTLTGENDISGTGSIVCSVVASDLSCMAQGGTVVLAASTGAFIVEVSSTPSSSGDYANPRSEGSCAVDPANVVSEDNEGNNSCSNSVGVEDSPDVVAVKTNDVSGAVTSGQTFTWSIRVENQGDGEWIIPGAEQVLLDELPDADVAYGDPTVSDSSGLAGTMTCSVDASSDLTCVADSSLGLSSGGFFVVDVEVTPSVIGTLNNPRSGGECSADPSDNDLETDEQNNGCSDTVESALFADGFESSNTSAWSLQK